ESAARRVGADSILRGRCRGRRRRYWASRGLDADAVHQPVHEAFAESELIEAHPFVRLVGLVDAAGAADDRRDARLVEQAGLRAEGDLDRRVAAGERLR